MMARDLRARPARTAPIKVKSEPKSSATLWASRDETDDEHGDWFHAQECGCATPACHDGNVMKCCVPKPTVERC